MYAPSGVTSPYHLFQTVCARRTFDPPERATPTRVHRFLSATACAARARPHEHSA